ncbi:hypothetical protein [Actinomadura craniellae]|uniref:hypothetical protein n=1 Tax=Actinomadura craniellae TaxID=2231787 RepID=UPI0011BE498F|nr:hypothetical protein [Actinomadura craniellae]
MTVVLLGPDSADAGRGLPSDPGTTVPVAQAPKVKPLEGPTNDEFVPPKPTRTPKPSARPKRTTAPPRPRPAETRRACPLPFLPSWCERNGYRPWGE